MKSFLVGAVLLLAGCATKHPPIVEGPGHVLRYDCAQGEDCSKYPQPHWGPEHYECGGSMGRDDCELVQGTTPSQLSPVGCALHKVVTLGHTAQECKKPKRPTSRRSR